MCFVVVPFFMEWVVKNQHMCCPEGDVWCIRSPEWWDLHAIDAPCQSLGIVIYIYIYIYFAYFDFWDLGRCQLYYLFLILFLSSIFTWLTRLKDQTYTMPLYLPLGSYRRLLRMKSCTTWHVQNPRKKNRMIWILYLSQLARGFLPSPKHMGHMCFEAASQLETHCPWPHAAAGDCCLSKVARVPGWRLMVVLDPKHIWKIC